MQDEQTIQELKEAICKKVEGGLEARRVLMVDSEVQGAYFENDKMCRDYKIGNDRVIEITSWEGMCPLENGLPNESPVNVAELINALAGGEVVTPGTSILQELSWRSIYEYFRTLDSEKKNTLKHSVGSNPSNIFMDNSVLKYGGSFVDRATLDSTKEFFDQAHFTANENFTNIFAKMTTNLARNCTLEEVAGPQ